MCSARDFGLSDDPFETAEGEVAPYRALSLPDRYARFLDLVATMERIWETMPPEKRRRSSLAADELDDLGRWWERVPSREREA